MEPLIKILTLMQSTARYGKLRIKYRDNNTGEISRRSNKFKKSASIIILCAIHYMIYHRL